MASSLLPTPEPPDPVEGALGHFEHSNWVKASLKALDQGTMRNTGGQLFESVQVDNPATETADIYLTGNSNRSIWGEHSPDRASRWRLILGDSTAESGNDSGSLFQLIAYGDSGYPRTALQGSRATGLLTVAGDPTTGKGIATKDYVDSAIPLGTIIAWGGQLPLTGAMAAAWHPCDGTVHNSSALAALVGPTTPDLAGLFLVGAGTNKDASTGSTTTYAVGKGAKLGKEQVTLVEANTPVKSHRHSIDHDHGSKTSGVGSSHNHAIDHNHGSVYTDYQGTHHHGGYQNNWVGSSMDQNPAGTDYSPIGQGPGHPDPPPLASSAGNHRHSVDLPAFAGTSGPEAAHTHSVSVPALAGGMSGYTSDSVGITAHENRPPYYALVYLIKKV